MSYSQEVPAIVLTDSTVVEGDYYAASDVFTPRVFSGLYRPYTGSIMPYEGLYGQPSGVSPDFYGQNVGMPLITNLYDDSRLFTRLGGYVANTSLPGLMGIESGALSYTLSSEKFSFTPAVYVNKYGYFGGLITSLGYGGQMSYSLSPKFSITAFGAYHTKYWAPNPAVMANMQSSRFGGYGTWNINDRWSLSAGAQRVYNSATNRWQTIPIVMPTFKINDKAAIGLDIGGLLYEVIDWYRTKSSHRYGNPTIGPPIKPQTAIPPYNP